MPSAKRSAKAAASRCVYRIGLRPALLSVTCVAVAIALHIFRTGRLRPELEPRPWPVDGLAGLANRSTPFVGRGPTLPSASWRAHSKWQSSSYIATKLSPLSRVWERLNAHGSHSEESMRSFVYFSEGGDASTAAHGGMRAPPSVQSGADVVTMHRVMTANAFLEGVERGQLLYCSNDAAALSAAALADVQPLAPYDLRSTDEQREHPTNGIVWLGAGKTVTHAHYDTSHNVFVQVVGRKHFTLWAPSAHHDLRLFPTRHSLHRQSSWARPAADNAAGASAFRKGGVTLEPGDALVCALPRKPMTAFQVPFRMSNACAMFRLPSVWRRSTYHPSTRITYLR